jgi:hypothetical protein
MSGVTISNFGSAVEATKKSLSTLGRFARFSEAVLYL